MIVSGVGSEPPHVGYLNVGDNVSVMDADMIDKIPVGSVIRCDDGFHGFISYGYKHVGYGTRHKTIIVSVHGHEYTWGQLLTEPKVYTLVYLADKESE